MSTLPRFHDLRVARISPEAAGSVAVALQVPDDLLARFDFQPGQYLTLRSRIDGAEVRRSYSIISMKIQNCILPGCKRVCRLLVLNSPSIRV